jgi:XRE family transcriptional regulator, aerobic/anaerobic benzoate catabolism transcriptional regulator
VTALKELGRQISELRRRKGLTREQLARRSRLSLRFLAAVETGQGNISIARLISLCRVLGVPIDSIFSMVLQCNDQQLKELHLWLSSQLDNRPERIALIGLRGAGKTTIGKKLASALKWKFVELDQQIEKAAGLNLQNIFEVHGEEYYRRLEQEVLLDLILRNQKIVLATGGGIVMRDETYNLLHQNFFIVWLKADPHDHWNRVLQQDPRPMTNYPDAFTQLQNLLQRRESLYARANSTVNTSDLGVQGSVKQIISEVRSASAAGG